MDLNAVGTWASIANLAITAIEWLERHLPFRRAASKTQKPLQGEEVFIAARNIDNRGEIISRGRKPKISIFADRLSNKGSIKTERKSGNKG